MPCLVYHGSGEERAALRAQHMDRPPSGSAPYPVFITSYEIAMRVSCALGAARRDGRGLLGRLKSAIAAAL